MYATINPPTIGAANAQYKFWCIVEDDDAPFLVRVPTDAYIADLKVLIQEQRKYGALQGVDAARLALWTVSHFQ
jgi:hypothetical protein